VDLEGAEGLAPPPFLILVKRNISDPKYLNFWLFLSGGPPSPERPPPLEISGSVTGVPRGGSVQLLNVQSIATKNYLGPPPLWNILNPMENVCMISHTSTKGQRECKPPFPIHQMMGI
jgi:hypothetical protein